ncbi:MAG: hypothetical protein MJE77_08265 [Proteobacteria bacterium]|nr:hypothetical protein [Pseudomonadota bacterium]
MGIADINGYRVLPRVPVKCDKPLYTQYRSQRKALSITNQRLASEAEVALTTVARELGVEPFKPMSLQLAQRLGNMLGFDPAHVALVHARDMARFYEKSRKLSERVKRQFQNIRRRLDRYLLRQIPFALESSGRRLALTLERCRRGISIDRLARAAHDETGVSPLQLGRYEHGLNTVCDDVLRSWLHALSDLSPSLEPISLGVLDRIAQSLHTVHHAFDTLEWRSYKSILNDGHKLLCPYEPGYELRIGTSATLYGPVEIKYVQAIQPKKVARSRVRIIGARSRGIQLGVLVKGTAELVLGQLPFSNESTDDLPRYEVGKNGITHKRICGPGEVVIVPGDICRRVEFRSRDCLLIIISIQSNLLLSRPQDRQGPGSTARSS